MGVLVRKKSEQLAMEVFSKREEKVLCYRSFSIEKNLALC